MSAKSTCPCGGLPAGSALAVCCGPALDGTVWPATAEALMRSRYTAFSQHHEDHLFRTWHPRTRPAGALADPAVTWLGLTVEETSGGGPEDSEGTVTFTARYRDAAGAGTLSEHSAFVRRAGRWMYLEAVDE